MMARLLRGVGANLYAQAATVAIQFVSVPLLLAAWGPARYGTWTLLTAVPAALAFADGGLVLASGNAMAMMVGRGDLAAAAALFRQALRRTAILALTLGSAAVAAIHLAPVALAGGEVAGARLTLDLLAAATLLGVFATVPAAALRAGGAYAPSVAATTTLRLVETGTLVAAAWLGGGLPAAAGAWAAVRLAGVPLLFGLTHRRVPWLRHPDPETVLPPLLAPAAAALALPACLALGLQGVTLAIGVTQPPEAVAAFGAVRTLARALVQAVGLVTHAVMPDLSRAAGRGDAAGAEALVRLGRTAALTLLLPGWLVLIGAGPVVFMAWTGNRLSLPAGTLPLVATAALLHGLWLTRANLLLALNRQADYAAVLVLATAATVLLASLLAAWAGLRGAAAATLAGEGVMLLHVARLDRRPKPRQAPTLAASAS